MKKKLTAALLCVCMLAIALIGGTMAYFTDTDANTNTMAYGSVSIDQWETLDPIPMIPYEDEVGKTLENKVVTVVNDGKSDAYVRTIVAIEHTDPNGDGNFSDGIAWAVWTDYADDKNAKVFSGELDNLKVGNKYYSIQLVEPFELAAGAQTETLQAVWFDNRVTNEMLNGVDTTYDVLVLSQAVQADGWEAGTTADEAFEAAFGEFNATNVAAWLKAIDETQK